MDHWLDESPATGPGFDRYERVMFDPAVLIGKWEWDRDRSGGDPDDPRFFEFEITPDHAKFTFNPYFDPEQARTFIQEGAYTVDSATLYLNPEMPDRHRRLFAFAPTDKSPMEVVVSAYWDEERERYGGYWLHMRKLEASAE